MIEAKEIIGKETPMLESLRRRLKILLGIVIVLLPLIIVARILIVVNFIDPQTLFYERDAVLPDIFNAVIYGLVLLALLSGVLFRLRFASSRVPRLRRRIEKFSCAEPSVSEEVLSEEKEEEPRASAFARLFERSRGLPELSGGTRLVYENTAASTVFASTLTGFIFIASAILIAAGMLMENRFGAMNFVTLAVAVLSGAFFLLAGMKRVYPYAKAFGALSMVPSLWCILRLIGDFWDLSQNSNEYSHVLQIACLVCLTLFFFTEGKFTLPSANYYSFGLYVASALASLLVIATVSVPNLLLASFWMVDFKAEVFHSLVEFTVGIYIIAKLFSLLRKLENFPEEELASPKE